MDKTSLSFSLINILRLLYLLKFYLPLILPEEKINFKKYVISLVTVFILMNYINRKICNPCKKKLLLFSVF